MKDELRVIPKKNYIILAIVILVTLLLLYYFYLWFDAYNESKLNKPILNKYMEVINYNELNDYIIENPDTIVYVSVLENKEIRDFEKIIKGYYKKNMIDKDILYMDITSEINNKNIKNDMIDKYSVGSFNMSDVPLIIVFEDGIVKDIYSVKDNNYSIDSFKLFIDSIKFSNESDVNG